MAFLFVWEVWLHSSFKASRLNTIKPNWAKLFSIWVDQKHHSHSCSILLTAGPWLLLGGETKALHSSIPSFGVLWRWRVIKKKMKAPVQMTCTVSSRRRHKVRPHAKLIYRAHKQVCKVNVLGFFFHNYLFSHMAEDCQSQGPSSGCTWLPS